MRDIDQIRRSKLAQLVAEYGTVAKLADILDKSPSLVSQWLNGSKDSRTGKPRGFRKETARYIEDRCKKPRGWMDSADAQPEIATGAPVVEMEFYIQGEDERNFLRLFRRLDPDGGGREHVMGELKKQIKLQVHDPTSQQQGGRSGAVTTGSKT